MDASSLSGDFDITSLAHRDAVGRGHPPHQGWTLAQVYDETVKVPAC
jgi:hypothetical protein